MSGLNPKEFRSDRLVFNKVVPADFLLDTIYRYYRDPSGFGLFIGITWDVLGNINGVKFFPEVQGNAEEKILKMQGSSLNGGMGFYLVIRVYNTESNTVIEIYESLSLIGVRDPLASYNRNNRHSRNIYKYKSRLILLIRAYIELWDEKRSPLFYSLTKDEIEYDEEERRRIMNNLF